MNLQGLFIDLKEFEEEKNIQGLKFVSNCVTNLALEIDVGSSSNAYDETRKISCGKKLHYVRTC